MATALDLLMSTKEDVNLLSEESDICTIDAKTRAIFVPSTIVVGGVQSDKNAERIKFSCPKIVGDNLDLSKFSVRINFENVSSVDFNVSIKDQYICDDVAVDGENVTFSWLIGRNAARYMGTVRFIVCAVKTDSDSNISVEWNTAIAEVPVLEGIEIDQPQIGQEEKDVINQLLELTKNTSAEAVQNVNSAKEQAIKDIQSVSQPDTTLTIEGGLAEAKATGEAIASLKEDLTELGNKILYEEYADLLHGKEPKEKWYIDASNGTGRTLAQFFSYIDIDVSEYIGKKLYPYTSHKGTNVYHSSRSVVFYDESGTFISGTGVSSNNPINGIEVPKKSKTASICFNYESDNNQPIKPQVYYLAINRENKNKLMLKKDVLIDYEQIQNKPIIPTKMSELENDIVIDNVNDVQTIRKPTISFIFDDGLPSTSDLVSLFDSYGWKCGFAILANSNLPNIKDNFLSYQSKGYEILSHSTDGVAMQDGSLTIDDVETKMKKSKEILINNGFNITGWVTPSTWLNNKYFDNLCKYYEYGFGHLDTNQVVNHHTFWGNDIRQLERWSLQSKTLEQTKAEIDSTINECGYLCFYAHAYPSTQNDNFTIENMKIIMDYIKKYIDNGKVQVLTPRCAINDYYTVRHSDLLDLYKKVIN